MKSHSRVPARAGTLVLAFGIFWFFTLAAAAQEAGDVAAGPTPGFTGVSLAVANSVVPPGGMFQYQLMLTEPKPIGNSSSRPTLPSGSPSGITLNDPMGVTAGVATIGTDGIRVITTSPLSTFGTSPDLEYPIVAIAMQISSDAVVGSQFPISVDLANSFWLDPFGQPYPQEVRPGTLTIGGTLNISNVVPGGGFQPAGSRISIFGMGFTPLSRLAIEGVTLTVDDYQVVSPNQIDVVLPQGLRMDGARVRVKNKNGEVARYFSYLRTQPLGQSANALVNRSYPLFARTTYTSATMAWQRDAATFSALALENPGTTSAEVTVEMRSAANEVLGSFSFPLPPMSKITRDLTDFFSQPPAAAAQVHVTSTQRLRVLGLLGDQTAGTMVPVIVTAP
jgi:hypothetical protein